jgi:hypothetical protein
MSKKQAYVDMVIERIAEAQNITVAEAAKQYLKESEYSLDFDNLPKQAHKWTDRGLKLTCENANHPAHEAWKVRQPSI